LKENQQTLQASILDRLVDHEPKISHEPVQYRLLSIAQIKASVIRDLENLLNTRRQILPLPAQYREVNNSVFVYGLRDFTSKSPKNVAVRQQLRQDIEKAISRFEPRLKNVTVHIEVLSEKERNLRFRINGLLVVEPVAEPVSFDTYFDVNRGQYIISK
jgi:type VI secretion system protein ImpF